MMNLPNTSYRDMTIHGNDLVAGTYGRGIWVLDDISPLRQIVPETAAAPAHLFKPGDAIRVRRNVNGDTPASPEGPLALPGTYTVKLTVDGKSYTQPLVVTNDPRSPAPGADLRAQHDLQMKLHAGIKVAWDGYQQVAAMRAAVAALSRSEPEAEVTAAASAFDAKLAAIGGTAGGGRGRGGPGGAGGGGTRGATPPLPNFVGLNGSLIRQLDTLDFGDMAPNEPMTKVWSAGCADLKSTAARWAELNGKDLAAFNAILVKNSLGRIAAASPALAVPACVAAASAPVKR
jgi:hypothetical protein